VLHLYEEKRGDRDPAQGVVRGLVLKGGLLKDPKHIFREVGNAEAGRWIKFTAPKEISALQPILRSYI